MFERQDPYIQGVTVGDFLSRSVVAGALKCQVSVSCEPDEAVQKLWTLMRHGESPQESPRYLRPSLVASSCVIPILGTVTGRGGVIARGCPRRLFSS